MECDGQGIWVVVFSDIYFKIKEESKNESSASKSHGKAVGLYKFKNVQTDRNQQQQHSFIVFSIFCIFYKFYFSASKSHGKAAGRTTECTSRPPAGACRRSGAHFSYSDIPIQVKKT